jgi:hypothetical protein
MSQKQDRFPEVYSREGSLIEGEIYSIRGNDSLFPTITGKFSPPGDFLL